MSAEISVIREHCDHVRCQMCPAPAVRCVFAGDRFVTAACDDVAHLAHAVRTAQGGESR